MSMKQHVILLIALLAFIGQSMAAVRVSCSMMDMEDDGNVDMMHMDHSMQGMQHQQGEPDGADSCCGDIECMMAQCGILYSAIIDDAVFPGTNLVSGALVDTSASDTFSNAKSLFRPPISR